MRTVSQIKEREPGIAALDELWPQAVDRPELAQLFVNHAYRILDRRKAADRAEELVKRWPDLEGLLYQSHRTLLWDHRVEAAATVASRVQSLSNGEGRWDGLLRARQACAEGRRVEAETLLAQVPESELSQRWQLLMLLGRTKEAAESLQPLERARNTFALASFLIHPEFDPTPYPSLMKILERENVQRTPELPPFACPAEETQ